MLYYYLSTRFFHSNTSCKLACFSFSDSPSIGKWRTSFARRLCRNSTFEGTLLCWRQISALISALFPSNCEAGMPAVSWAPGQYNSTDFTICCSRLLKLLPFLCCEWDQPWKKGPVVRDHKSQNIWRESGWWKLINWRDRIFQILINHLLIGNLRGT